MKIYILRANIDGKPRVLKIELSRQRIQLTIDQWLGVRMNDEQVYHEEMFEILERDIDL